MRFCTGKNSIILLTALLCQLFFSCYLCFQTNTATSSGSALASCDVEFECGLSATSGPAATYLEGKKQNSTSGNIAQRFYALISALTRHLSESAQSIQLENRTFKPGLTYWLIYCSIRR